MEMADPERTTVEQYSTTESQASLDGLPTEILLQIAETFTIKEFKALRCLSRRLNVLASERVLESITIAAENSSFIQLLHIASSPFWSSHVRNIDWVLLNQNACAYIHLDAVTIKHIESFGSWTDDLIAVLKNIGVRRLLTCHVLELCCLLARKLSNVQTVTFLREGHFTRIDFTDREHERRHNFLSNEFERNQMQNVLHSGQSPRLRTANNIFCILSHSRLRPTTIRNDFDSVHLTYFNENQPHDVKIISKIDTYKTYLDTGTYPDVDSFGLLGKSSVDSLRSLTVSKTRIYWKHVHMLLIHNRHLHVLHIDGAALLTGDPYQETHMPPESFLNGLRFHHGNGRLRDVSLTLENVRDENVGREFSASATQIQAWMRGDNELFVAAKAALFPSSSARPIDRVACSTELPPFVPPSRAALEFSSRGFGPHYRFPWKPA